MNITGGFMTLMDMFTQGNFMQLSVMVLLFILWVVLLLKIGNGVAAKAAAEKVKERKAIPPAADNKAITAAITAAVNEYRKKYNQ